MTGIVDFRTELLGETGAPITALNPLPTTGGGGGGGGNSAAGPTGAAVPTDAGYTGFNSGGNLVGVSSANPLPVDIGAVGVLDVSDSTAELLLTRMLNYLNSPMGYDKSLQRQRATVLVESGTVTTVTTVTTLSNIDTYNARMTVLDTNRTAWAQCVRARIT
jgi:hypothetical protein